MSDVQGDPPRPASVADADGEATSPSIESARMFFKNVTLPRYVPKQDSPGDFRKLEPGDPDPDGKLYDLWTTPFTQLGDFGIGIGLYFNNLLVLCALMLLGGLINAWTINYFHSEEFTGNGKDGELPVTLYGSAVCLGEEVVCLDANCSTFRARRTCEVHLTQGYLDFATILVLLAVLGVMEWSARLYVKIADEQEQTAQDYAVEVMDPSPDATDPEEWRNFFESLYGRVCYVTVAVDNGVLLKCLAERRKIWKHIHTTSTSAEEEEQARNVEANMERDPSVPWWKVAMMPLGVFEDAVYWHEKLVPVTVQIMEEREKKLSAVKVFVIFDSESSQRQCLKELTTGLIPALTNTSVTMSENRRFRGTNVLEVLQPSEPTDVMWAHQEYSMQQRLYWFLRGMAAAALVVTVAALLVWGVSAWDTAAAAILISVNNTVLPMILKQINLTEGHYTASKVQASLMLKIVAAQWMNTAFIIYIVKPYKDIPTEDYIGQVASILIADAVTSPLLLTLDMWGHFKRLVIAPMSTTQDSMNSYFLGTPVFMAERYATMVKTVFVTMFFAALYPAGYFIAAISMAMTYWASKYALFRLWDTPPPIDASLSQLARIYLSLAIIVHVIVTTWFYAGWPFDGLCVTDGQTVSQTMSAADVAEFPGMVLPAVGDPVYTKCDQSSTGVWLLPTEDWMTDDQAHLVQLFGVLGVVLTVVFVLGYFGQATVFTVFRLLWGWYVPVGKEKDRPYSEVEDIHAYIPEVEQAGDSRTLIATDLDSIDVQDISWTAKRPEAYQQLCLCSERDLPDLSREDRAKLFSSCLRTMGEDQDTEAAVGVEGVGVQEADDGAGGEGPGDETIDHRLL